MADLPSLFLCDKDRDSLLAAGLLLPREERVEVRLLSEQRLLEEVWPEPLGPFRQVHLIGLPPEASPELVADRCKEAEKVYWLSGSARGFTSSATRAYRAVAPNLRVTLAEDRGPLPLATAACKTLEKVRRNIQPARDALAEVASGEKSTRVGVLDGIGRNPTRTPDADLPDLLRRLTGGRYSTGSELEEEFRKAHASPLPGVLEAAESAAKTAEKMGSAVYLTDPVAIGAVRRPTLLLRLLADRIAGIAFLLHRPGWLFGALPPGDARTADLLKFFQEGEVDGVRFGGEPKGHAALVSVPGIRAESGGDHAAACRKVVEAIARLGR